MSLVEVGNNAVFVDWKYIDDIRQIRFIHKIHAQRSEDVRVFYSFDTFILSSWIFKVSIHCALNINLAITFSQCNLIFTGY